MEVFHKRSRQGSLVFCHITKGFESWVSIVTAGELKHGFQGLTWCNVLLLFQEESIWQYLKLERCACMNSLVLRELPF